MKSRVFTACIVAGMFAPFITIATAKEDPEAAARKTAELRSRIESLKQEASSIQADIERTDSLRRAEKERSDKLDAARKADLERRQNEIAEISQRMEEASSKVAAEKSRQYAHEAAGKELDLRSQALVKQMSQHAERLSDQVALSVPYEREERSERVRVLRQDLETNVADEIEAFSRLSAVLGEEIRFGDEIALFDKPITRSDGEVINARILKMGNQWMAYAGEEGKHYGLLMRKSTPEGWTYEWKEELAFQEREAVRLAIDVKSAQKPPQLVDLPTSLSFGAVDTSKGDN